MRLAVGATDETGEAPCARHVQTGAVRADAQEPVDRDRGRDALHLELAEILELEVSLHESSDVFGQVGLPRFGELLHHYTAVDGGASFYTEMRVDVQLPMIGSLLTRLARRFRANDRLLRTWIQHNVEGSGETEKFVPALFQRAMQEPTLTP